MIEKIVLDHLSRRIGVKAYMEYPADPPERFIVVEKTSGGMTDYIRSAMIVVQSVAETLLEAAELNETVKETMEALTDDRDIASCRLNTDYNFTDSETKRYRYQAVFDITHY